MAEQVHSTPVYAGRSSIRQPPVLTGDLKAVADAVTTWPDVVATSRGHFAHTEQDDGIDFRLGEDELGHMHFDGSIHLASGPNLCAALVAEGLGRPSPWARGWLEARVGDLGVERAVALFRRNYDRLRPSPRSSEAGPPATLNASEPPTAGDLSRQTGSRTLLIKNAAIVTMDGKLTEHLQGDILVEGDRISQIGANIEAHDAAVVDTSGMIAVPRFVDSHRHLWEGLLRNALPDGTLMDYFQTVNQRFGPAYTPADVYAGTLISALGALNAGVTTVLDWAHIQNSPEHTDASIKALRDSGVRGVFAFGTPTAMDQGHRYLESGRDRYALDTEQRFARATV